MMLGVAFLLIGVLTVFCAAASVRAVLIHRQPTMDSVTARRVAAALNRGVLPPDEPVRSAARLVAKARVESFWACFMMLGLAAMMLLMSRQGGPVPAAAYWAAAAFLMILAAMMAFLTITARRALAAGSRGLAHTSQ